MDGKYLIIGLYLYCASNIKRHDEIAIGSGYKKRLFKTALLPRNMVPQPHAVLTHYISKPLRNALGCRSLTSFRTSLVGGKGAL